MKPSNLFLLIVFTALAVVLFMTGLPELCAIATFICVGLIMGWADLIDSISTK